MASYIERRKFLATLGVAAAWPLAARAQQPALPVIGLLDPRTPDAMAGRLAGFRQGLKEVGFAEGENVRILYHWAENQPDRLPEMAADLIRQQAAVIFTAGGPASAFAAKAATTTIPVVFLVGEDPARLGLVSNLARPTGNLTGFNLFINELEAKRLELLHQLVPGAVRIAVLVNPAYVSYTEATLREVEAAARTIGVQTQVLKANTAREIEQLSTTIGQERPRCAIRGGLPLLERPACPTGPTGCVPPIARDLRLT